MTARVLRIGDTFYDILIDAVSVILYIARDVLLSEKHTDVLIIFTDGMDQPSSSSSILY